MMGEEENSEFPASQASTPEQQTDDIAQMAKEKEEIGDQIPGGKADGKSPADFDLNQLAMGVDVEMEHTDDPMKAFEIAMDHLAEFPDYYTRLKKMEDQAEVEHGGEDKSIEKPSDEEDKEMTNMLLGFKPKNVGDEVEGDEEEEEEPKKMDEMAAGNMKTKVFKIGEYAKGGIIKLVISSKAIQIEALDWNTKQPIESKSFMIDEPNVEIKIDEFLNDLTSSYYAGKIMDWIGASVGNSINEAKGEDHTEFVSLLDDNFKTIVLKRAEKMGLDGAFYFTIGEYMDKWGFDFDYMNDNEQIEELSELIIQKFPELEF